MSADAFIVDYSVKDKDIVVMISNGVTNNTRDETPYVITEYCRMWLDDGYYDLSNENTICKDLTEFARKEYGLIVDGTRTIRTE